MSLQFLLVFSTLVYVTWACSGSSALKKYLINHMSGKLNIPLTYTTRDPLFHYERDQSLLNARLEGVNKVEVESVEGTNTAVTAKLKFKQLFCKYERYTTNDEKNPSTKLFWISTCKECPVSVELTLSGECTVSAVKVTFTTLEGLDTNLLKDTGLPVGRMQPALQQMNLRDKLVRRKLREELVKVLTGLSLSKKGIFSC